MSEQKSPQWQPLSALPEGSDLAAADAIAWPDWAIALRWRWGRDLDRFAPSSHALDALWGPFEGFDPTPAPPEVQTWPQWAPPPPPEDTQSSESNEREEKS